MSFHNTTTGMASGWSVHYSGLDKRWHWRSWGPGGTTMSTAATEEEAKKAAQTQRDNLVRASVARDAGSRAVTEYGDALKRLGDA